MGDAFARAVSPALARTHADTLITELLPLLDACHFLEQNAERLLQTRVLGSQGRPLWLRGIEAEVERDALGQVLILGPSNFPLFLPGVQALQALTAGNAVTWKPGSGGRGVADLFAQALLQAGLPPNVLRITDDSIGAAIHALNEQPDKVFFTGSADTGKEILTRLAETTTPSVMELSGADAVIVLPSADLALAAKAIAFGLRLNGGALCMSPRRLLALGDTMSALVPLLEAELASVPPAALAEGSAVSLAAHLDQAVRTGARVRGELNPSAQKPLLIDGALPHMTITCADIFAPVLSLFTVSTIPKFPDVYAECPMALTVSIFGQEQDARRLAAELRAGAVLINDIIAPTADPRVPFGGRDASGFGVTRGAEGLLEMTAAKTVLVRRKGSARHYTTTTEAHAPLFNGMIRAAHGRTWLDRLHGVRQIVTASRKLKP